MHFAFVLCFISSFKQRTLRETQRHSWWAISLIWENAMRVRVSAPHPPSPASVGRSKSSSRHISLSEVKWMWLKALRKAVEGQVLKKPHWLMRVCHCRAGSCSTAAPPRILTAPVGLFVIYFSGFSCCHLLPLMSSTANVRPPPEAPATLNASLIRIKSGLSLAFPKDSWLCRGTCP